METQSLNLLMNPAFKAYVITAVVLSLNMLLLWAFSGAARVGTKTALNPEDVSTVSRGANLVEVDPPEVARVLRAHANAHYNIMPFLLLGLIYVLVGAGAGMATGIFGVFTLARLTHSFVYIKGLQPWRTLSFGVGGLAALVLIVDLLRIVLTS